MFVHVPKTAGQSVERTFLDRLGLTWQTRAPLLLRPNDRPELGPPRLAHLTAAQYVDCRYLPRELFAAYFTFGFVRNPWDRVVSIYRYWGFASRCDFRTFLLGPFRGRLFEQRHWFARPQVEFLYGEDDRPLVEFVGRFERLQADFDHVRNRLGLPRIALPHVNRSRGAATPRSSRDGSYRNHYSYRDHYDRECVDCVARLYRRDVELLGYAFD